MSKEWSQFYLSIAGMGLTCALIANLSADSAINIGPLSAWFAAIATFFAVIVALFNTERTIKDAVRREIDSDKRAAERFRTLVFTLSFRMKTALIVYWKNRHGKPISKRELEFLENRLRLDETIGILSRAPLHQAPDRITILQVELLLFNAHTCAHRLRSLKSQLEDDDLDTIEVDFGEQLKTFEEICDALDAILES